MDKEKKLVAEKIFDAYFSGKLPPELKSMVMDWFLDHADQIENYEALRRLWDERVEYDARPDKSVYESFNKLCKRLGLEYKESPIFKRKRKIQRQLIYKIAAVTIPVLIIAGTVTAIMVGKTNETAGVAMLEEKTISITENDKMQAILSDGTEIWLNDHTRVENEKRPRSVELQGEAYFKVAHTEAGEKFVVNTDCFKVTVLGTVFNVKSYSDNIISTISLYEGLLEVSVGDREHIMTEGQELVYNKSTKELDIYQMHTVKPEWMSQSLIFQYQPLADILVAIADIYDITLDIDKSLHQEIITLKLAGNESLEGALSMLSRVSGNFVYEIEGDNVSISK